MRPLGRRLQIDGGVRRKSGRPIDAPLLTFGQNGIFVKTLDKFTVPEKTSMVFNLFNNQWGTNFPLYTEGNMCFEFEIMDLATARKTLPLARTEDFDE